MKRLILSLVFILGAAVGFSAQSTGTIVLDFGNPLTINVTAAQRTKLQRLLNDSNAARAEQTPALPAQTLEQWLRAKLIETVQSEIRTAESHEQAEACQRFKALTVAKQNAIVTELGGSPCR